MHSSVSLLDRIEVLYKNIQCKKPLPNCTGFVFGSQINVHVVPVLESNKSGKYSDLIFPAFSSAIIISDRSTRWYHHVTGGDTALALHHVLFSVERLIWCSNPSHLLYQQVRRVGTLVWSMSMDIQIRLSALNFRSICTSY